MTARTAQNARMLVAAVEAMRKPPVLPPLSTLDALAHATELLEELLPADHALLIRIQDAWGRAECEAALTPSFTRQHSEEAH